MRFRELKRFVGKTLPDVVSWLSNELNSVLRELYVGLGKLSFDENFKSLRWEGTLAVSEEKQIPHPFGKIPDGYLIFKQVGNALVDAGTTPWTKDVVYLRNNDASNSVDLTVFFFG